MAILTRNHLSVSVEAIERSPDILICALGYESRCTSVAKKIAFAEETLKFAIGFDEGKIFSYEKNKRYFKQTGFSVIESSGHELRSVILNILDAFKNREVSAVVDCSCFTTLRLGAIVESFRELVEDSGLTIHLHLVYCIAEFHPAVGVTAPLVKVDPVLSAFSGWTSDAFAPPAGIIGLGYEQDKALAAVENLELDNGYWTFIPTGPIQKYEAEVVKANSLILPSAMRLNRRRFYEICDPAKLYAQLEDLSLLLSRDFRVLFIPLGPKIFAVICLLISAVNPEIGVWRVSSTVEETAADRKGSNEFSCLFVTIERG